MKISANVVDFHIKNTIIPIFKKKERQKPEKGRPLGILNCFPKIYEKFLLEKFKPFISSFLSEKMTAYRESYSTNHVLIRSIENWKKAIVGKGDHTPFFRSIPPFLRFPPF